MSHNNAMSIGIAHLFCSELVASSINNEWDLFEGWIFDTIIGKFNSIILWSLYYWVNHVCNMSRRIGYSIIEMIKIIFASPKNFFAQTKNVSFIIEKIAILLNVCTWTGISISVELEVNGILNNERRRCSLNTAQRGQIYGKMDFQPKNGFSTIIIK